MGFIISKMMLLWRRLTISKMMLLWRRFIISKIMLICHVPKLFGSWILCVRLKLGEFNQFSLNTIFLSGFLWGPKKINKHSQQNPSRIHCRRSPAKPETLEVYSECNMECQFQVPQAIETERCHVVNYSWWFHQPVCHIMLVKLECAKRKVDIIKSLKSKPREGLQALHNYFGFHCRWLILHISKTKFDEPHLLNPFKWTCLVR